MYVTPYQIAERFIGTKELPGDSDNPFVMAMLRLDSTWPQHDEVPWCSAYVNFVFWLLRLPRSKSLMARSWLQVGAPIQATEAEVGHDIVILKRGGLDQPGADVLEAPGHVGFFSGAEFTSPHGTYPMTVSLLGGNQSNAVTVQTYPGDRLLGVRRIGHPL